ncbi:hypothetical protein M2397_001657 [Pseudomonas sp. BIGb0381]|uniref:hypothetical protein n=1 Tax=Pseudomonas sp. JAI120 TaxID=2723063 RepID=UPI001613AEC7|nr:MULTISPECIES: hypothetical protein [unclassified Pseudomonas]MBB6287246.1 hypothetical protein [Pseudomonas sp. SJZ073]MBB6310827.1 hypothetical protein [Pseudomonas sp. JAI120]MCS4311364.1 hypothetical protein [Pseudomonas sp. BIGb0381]
MVHDKPPHAIVQFLQALNNPFIYVLLTKQAERQRNHFTGLGQLRQVPLQLRVVQVIAL